MFKDVPLVNIDTKDLNVKIPALTSDDINKYESYLTLWIEKNGKILEDRTSMINETLALCGTTDKQEAKTNKARLETERIAINNNKNLTEKDKSELNTRIDSEIKDMDKIIALPQDTTRQKMGSDFKNI
ncbi:MAG: hypothetical protein WCL02_02980 [bacterium]